MKTAVCVIVRNEDRYIREWIAYQHAIGFQTILVYDNASSDNTVSHARDMANLLDVRIHDWNTNEPAAQLKCYERCIHDYNQEFDWIAVFDCDEFPAARYGEPLYEMLYRNRQASAVALNWACYGSSGHASYRPEPMFDRFQRRAPSPWGPNKHTKMIVRPKAAGAFANPHACEIAGAVVTPDGVPIAWESPGITSRPEHSSWQLNHYFTRSRDEWGRKVARGYAAMGDLGVVRDLTLFTEYDRNEVFDPVARQYAPIVDKVMRAFVSAADLGGPFYAEASQ